MDIMCRKFGGPGVRLAFLHVDDCQWLVSGTQTQLGALRSYFVTTSVDRVMPTHLEIRKNLDRPTMQSYQQGAPLVTVMNPTNIASKQSGLPER